MYEYVLHDGTNGVVYADYYKTEEKEHEFYTRKVSEYVFYRDKMVVYRIPCEWTESLRKLR